MLAPDSGDTLGVLAQGGLADASPGRRFRSTQIERAFGRIVATFDGVPLAIVGKGLALFRAFLICCYPFKGRTVTVEPQSYGLSGESCLKSSILGTNKGANIGSPVCQ